VIATRAAGVICVLAPARRDNLSIGVFDWYISRLVESGIVGCCFKFRYDRTGSGFVEPFAEWALWVKATI
jgi:hypothetical protein